MQRVIDPLPHEDDTELPATPIPAQEPAPQQPVSPASVFQLPQPPAQGAVVSAEEPLDPQPAQGQLDQNAKLSRKDPMPIGMSASELGLDSLHKSYNWQKFVKNAVIILFVVAVLAGGYVLLKGLFSGMATKTLSNGGYTYTFTYYKSAKQVTLDNGSKALKDSSSTVVTVGPTTVNPPPVCTDITYKMRQISTVTIGGTSYLVCAQNNTDFTMFFTAQNHNHMMTLAYSKQQNSATLPKIENIFSSIKVSQ